nr:hypothetical protein [Arthrobacter sp. JCM 19049]
MSSTETNAKRKAANATAAEEANAKAVAEKPVAKKRATKAKASSKAAGKASEEVVDNEEQTELRPTTPKLKKRLKTIPLASSSARPKTTPLSSR